MLNFTDPAREAIRSADAAARRFNPQARVRLRLAGSQVASDLTDGVGPGERAIDLDGVEVIVAEDLDGTLDTGEHGAFFLR